MCPWRKGRNCQTKFISAVQTCQSTLEGAEATWKVGAGRQWKGNWGSAPHPQKLIQKWRGGIACSNYKQSGRGDSITEIKCLPGYTHKFMQLVYCYFLRAVFI